MRMKECMLLLLSCSICACAMPTSKYTETKDGVVLTFSKPAPSGLSRLYLRVVNDRVVHVQATADDELSEEKSLIAEPIFDKTAVWSVKPEKDSLFLLTKELRVAVSFATGELRFYDKEGKLILGESDGEGKNFTPIEVDGTKGYTIRQKFDSDDDEAFYGLGQHQSDEFNYKGKNEVLFQYNTKVSVPFVVSSKNYGILWDNYSVTKFGDSRDYMNLSQFKLFDKDGASGGLTATYLTDSNSDKVFCSRKEETIDYENLETIKNFPQGFKFGGSTITWEGYLEPEESGVFRFILYYAGYTKVYMNDQLVVPERWRTAWNPNSYKFTQTLAKGEKTKLKIEWRPDGGAYLGLKALSPVPDEEQGKLALWSEMSNQIDYYFIYGENMDKVISGYRNVTGKAQIMPSWAMGFWQSRERYKTQDEIVGALKEFRRRQIPIDNIVMDWSYWKEDQWGSHDFDPARFSDPKKMIQDIHDLNAHIMISVWPKFYLNTEHYKDLDKHGFIYQTAIRDSIRDWIGRGYIGSFYDPYKEEARKLFWAQMKEHLYDKGIDAWWMDASEPDIQSNASLEYRKKLCTPTGLGPSTKYFNTYALMNAKAIYEGQRSVAPNKRVFLLTRSGFAGLQRFSTATWSGDIGTRWEDMKAQISAGLNFSLSGIPYWTMDIGGFCVERRYENAARAFDKTGEENADMKEWRELNTRWYQFGAFAPLFRSHGQFPFREVYNIAPEGHPAYKSIVYYTKLRYRLMPYIYSLAGMTHFDDYTIMRAMVMDFGADKQVHDISNQYMFGPSVMVCPVYEYGVRERDVYFPEAGGWYDFYTGAPVAAKGMTKVAAPYEKLPLFVRAGAILPIGPQIQYTGQQKAKDITLYVYAGADGAFTLYEDEGENYNYEKGRCAKIAFSYNDAKKELTVADREGKFDGMLGSRTFNVVYVTPSAPAGFDTTIKGTRVDYDGKSVKLKLK